MRRWQQTSLAFLVLYGAVASSTAGPQVNAPPPTPPKASGLVGASTVLKRAIEQASIAAKPPASLPKTPADDYRDAVERLRGTPTVAEWLTLADRLTTEPGLSPPYSSGSEDVAKTGLALLMTAIPPPESWNDLAAAIRARPIGEGKRAVAERCLRLIAALLTADEAAQWAELDEIERAIGKLDAARGTSQFAFSLQQVSEKLAAISDDPSRRVATFEYQLRRAEQPREPDDLRSMEFFGLRVPDLVGLVGQERAEVYLRRAVRLPIMISVEYGDQTQKLARKIALEEIASLQAPQWKLCFTMEAADLYEALRAKFITAAAQKKQAQAADDDPAARIEAMQQAQREAFDQHDRDQAHGGARYHYFVALIAAGRFDDARAIANDFTEDEQPWYYHMYGRSDQNYTAVHAIANSPHAQKAAAFFHDLLADKPNLPFWETYSALEMNLARIDRLLALLRQAAESKDLDRRVRDVLRTQLKSTLLAVDQVDDAVAMLRADFTGEPDQYGRSPAGRAAVEMLKLGVLTERADLVNEALAEARKDMDNEKPGGERGQIITSIAEQLTAADRLGEAEAMLADELARVVAQADPNAMGRWSGTTPASLLRLLARVYWRAGRFQDVVALLDDAPWWGAKDLMQLQDDSRMDTSRETESLPAIAADALAKIGRRDEARRLARALLDQKPGLDAAYAVLADVDGAQAIAYFDERFARDQFEERPLIWKGETLRRAGRLEEAEQSVRQAIAIDPSDGEQGHGDRMRAYAVLAEIRAARGDAKEAELFRNVVQAIRTAERADDLYNGGLRQRGIDLYNQSLKFFADAYCIQSRLAVQLASLGRHAEAAEHYRRAYELMPDSFGRMESHCFGCEHVFDGLPAENLAEQVFTKLAAERPKDPRVRYLLGYLREQEARYDEALAEYQAAVRIDADYLNAWMKIHSLSYIIHVPAEMCDEAAVSLYRLRPNIHGWGSPLSDMHDLRRLWTAATQIRPAPIEIFDSLYPLSASNSQLEKLEAAQKQAGRRPGLDEDGWGGMVTRSVGQRKPPTTAGEALAEHGAISAVIALFGMCGT